MKSINKITLRIAAASALIFLASTGSAIAQSFPTKPVNLMVPYPAGGVSDDLARTINTPLSKILNQPVIIDNLGGASGMIAAQKVLNAPSDGYYLFQGSPNELILAPLTNASVKLKSEDFRLVQMVVTGPMAIFARPDFPASNGDELVSYAAKAAKAGKPITYASVGPGSFYHLLGAYLSKRTGIEMIHVPYKGAAPAFQDVMGSQVDIFISPYGKAQLELARQGRIKVVASLAPNRLDTIKNVPSVNESTALNGFNFNIWSGYFVKKDTPEPVVKVLHKALVEVLGDPNLHERLEARGSQVADSQTLEGAEKLYADGIKQFRSIAKSINLKAE
jgi:tripartite-type tricarboxylate transporter receptor subunit TctC